MTEGWHSCGVQALRLPRLTSRRHKTHTTSTTVVYRPSRASYVVMPQQPADRCDLAHDLAPCYCATHRPSQRVPWRLLNTSRCGCATWTGALAVEFTRDLCVCAQGSFIALVGEWRGDTGTRAFERYLTSNFRLVQFIPLPNFGNTACVVCTVGHGSRACVCGGSWLILLVR